MNNNIQESFCSFEVSKLLKEKGFHVPTWQSYRTIESDEDRLSWWKLGELNKPMYCKLNDSNDAYYGICSAPTHALAIEWIRVNFGIYINTFYGDDVLMYGWIVTTIKNNTEQAEQYRFNTPSDAIEAALLYTLQNLIP